MVPTTVSSLLRAIRCLYEKPVRSSNTVAFLITSALIFRHVQTFKSFWFDTFAWRTPLIYISAIFIQMNIIIDSFDIYVYFHFTHHFISWQQFLSALSAPTISVPKLLGPRRLHGLWNVAPPLMNYFQVSRTSGRRADIAPADITNEAFIVQIRFVRLEESSHHIFSLFFFFFFIFSNATMKQKLVHLFDVKCVSSRNGGSSNGVGNLIVSMAVKFLKCSERLENKKTKKTKIEPEKFLAVHCFNTNAHAIPVAYHYGIVRSVAMKWQKSCTFFPFVNIIILVVVGYYFSHLYSRCVMGADVHWHTNACDNDARTPSDPKWKKR